MSSSNGPWVYRNGKIVEKGGPEDVLPPIARSHLPVPHVVSDCMEAVQHPCTGDYLTSKRAFRRITKAHGCIEVGNDPARLKPFVKPKPDRKAIRRSIEKAFAQHASRS